MPSCFYVTLGLILTTQCIVRGEVLEVDGTGDDKDAVEKLSKEHADYASIEAILGKDPSKQDECNKQKDEYADEVQEFLKAKGKDDGSVNSIQISTEKFPLPVISKGEPCTARSTSDALYWFNKDLVNDVVSRAKAAHQDPQKALDEFTKSHQFQSVVENLKYIQEHDGVKDIISKGQNLNQMANDWLKSINFNIPGLTGSSNAGSDKEKKDE